VCVDSLHFRTSCRPSGHGLSAGLCSNVTDVAPSRARVFHQSPLQESSPQVGHTNMPPVSRYLPHARSGFLPFLAPRRQMARAAVRPLRIDAGSQLRIHDRRTHDVAESHHQSQERIYSDEWRLSTRRLS
jgi:hypothetical protein